MTDEAKEWMDGNGPAWRVWLHLEEHHPEADTYTDEEPECLGIFSNKPDAEALADKVERVAHHDPEQVEGWSNRETWSVALFIDNDARKLSHFTAAAERIGNKKGLRRYIEDRFQATGAASSEAARILAQCALARVNWGELAAHYMRKAAEL